MNENIVKGYREFLLNKVNEYTEIIDGLNAKEKTGTAMAYGIWLKAYQESLDKWDNMFDREIQKIDEARNEVDSIKIAQAEYNKEKHR